MNISSKTIIPATKRIFSTIGKESGTKTGFLTSTVTNNSNKANKSGLETFFKKLLSPTKIKYDYVKLTKQAINNMKESPDTKNVFNDFYKRILLNNKQTKKVQYSVGELAQTFEQIKQQEVKEIILTRLKSLNSKDNAKFFECYKEELDFLTSMTNAVNSIDGCYSQINNAPAKYYNSLKKKNSWLADAFEGIVKSPSEYSNKSISGEKKISYTNYLNNMESEAKLKTSKTFETDIRLAPFRDFVVKYASLYPKTTRKIYDVAYLPKLEPNISSVFASIKKDYDCMVIASNGNTTYKDALYLREEFDLFKKAGGNDTKFPKIFDIDNLNTFLTTKKSAGVTHNNTDEIIVRDLLSSDAKYYGQTVRHELIHENSDYDELHTIKDLYNAIVKWKKIILRNKKRIQKELTEAGLASEQLQKYGMSKKWELGPVSIEADHPEKYSKGYKKFLEEQCFVKDWFFNIKQNKYKVEAETERIKTIQKNFNA